MEFDDTCFKAVDMGGYGLPWGEAEYYCRQEGADLASIGTQAENDKIHAMLADSKYTYAVLFYGHLYAPSCESTTQFKCLVETLTV